MSKPKIFATTMIRVDPETVINPGERIDGKLPADICADLIARSAAIEEKDADAETAPAKAVKQAGDK